MKGLRVAKGVRGVEFEGVWGGLQSGAGFRGSGSRGVWGWLYFLCGVAYGGRGLISVFRGFSPSIGGAFCFGGGERGGWGLGYHSLGFRQFPDIS